MGLVTGLPVVAAALLASAAAGAEPPAPLREARVIQLPGVEKRIDHLAIDPAGKRLFVSALGNGSVEVIDLQAGKRVRSIAGLKEPQGLAYFPTLHKIVVANGGGTVVAFEDSSFKLVATIPEMDDADNLRIDSVTNQLYVGYGDGALGLVDPTTMTRSRRHQAAGASGVVSPGARRSTHLCERAAHQRGPGRGPAEADDHRAHAARRVRQELPHVARRGSSPLVRGSPGAGEAAGLRHAIRPARGRRRVRRRCRRSLLRLGARPRLRHRRRGIRRCLRRAPAGQPGRPRPAHHRSGSSHGIVVTGARSSCSWPLLIATAATRRFTSTSRQGPESRDDYHADLRTVAVRAECVQGLARFW